MSNKENKLEVSGLKVEEVFRNTGGNSVRVIVKAGGNEISISTLVVSFLLTEEVVSQPVLFRGHYPKQDIDPYKWNTLAENYKAKCKET
ncbi:unnamed protein product [Rhizophagus irregularis]|nr:unnamed protein product [Rhizophagus irregularis]